jgi:bis(5'-nucleosyl)-tetraphosphatase (symmetrical)
MATYVIGDIQGCFLSLQALLRQSAVDPALDRVIVAGDLVNRGPRSLEVLRWAVENRAWVDAVLGNHDLHLLARAFGGARAKGKDTLDEIFAAPDADRLLAWLRDRPLLIEHENYAIVHAGLHPQWTMGEARELARELEAAVQGERAANFFHAMYGSEPAHWSPRLSGADRLRFATNAFTRMRMLRQDGAIDMAFKGELEKAPAELTPWFDWRPLAEPNRPAIVFGHWSALGLLVRDDAIGLDTGCVWGGFLSAIRLEDRAVLQVASQDGAIPMDE